MEKIEEKKYLSDKITEWMDNNKKVVSIINFALYMLFVIIFIIITINMNDGLQKYINTLNYYPEQEYSQLEQELRNIVVESDGIHPEKLSNDSIYYDISYKESSDFEGQYTIELTDDVTVTGKIGKDFKKENLIIERKYKSASEFRRTQNILTFIATTLIPLFTLFILNLLVLIFMVVLLIIEKFIKKICKNKE